VAKGIVVKYAVPPALMGAAASMRYAAIKYVVRIAEVPGYFLNGRYSQVADPAIAFRA